MDWAVKPTFCYGPFVQISAGESDPQKLTRRGAATRDRILRHAAELIYASGVQATNNELVRNAAGVSGSQLSHYFPNKESLVRGVIDWQASNVLEFHRSDQFGGFDDIDAFQRWVDFFAHSGRPFEGGCSLGSLASEIFKSGLDVHEQLARVFEQWVDIFREGLEGMQRRGRLDASVDPIQLAHMFLAAYQGGVLLAQVARDVAPLQNALDAAVDHLRTFITTPGSVDGS